MLTNSDLFFFFLCPFNNFFCKGERVSKHQKREEFLSPSSHTFLYLFLVSVITHFNHTHTQETSNHAFFPLSLSLCIRVVVFNNRKVRFII